MRAVSQIVTHHTMASVFFSFLRTCVSRVPNLMKYTFFNALAALENGKLLPLQQETKPYGSSGVPLGCCDHSTLSVTVVAAA